MRNIQLMKDAFSSCTVSDGIIHLGGQFTPGELKDIYTWFSEDLLGSMIPHWRVVGFYQRWDNAHGQSALRKNDNYDQSIIELGMKMKYIIPDRIGGNDPEKGCFYGQAEDIKTRPEFDREYGLGSSASTRRANILKESHQVVGSIMVCRLFECENIVDLRSDNAYFTQASMVNEAEKPNYLIRNKLISNIIEPFKDADSTPTLIMFIKEGTGSLSYEDSRKLFVEEYDRVAPVRVSYDLSEFFTCATPNPGDSNTLRLVYWEDINENVLTEILRNYGRRLEENEY